MGNCLLSNISRRGDQRDAARVVTPDTQKREGGGSTMEEGDGGAALVRLIEKATISVDRKVDPRLLKSIKSSVRSSDHNVRVAVEALMDKMKKDHSQVRYLALLIIDELFMRSKLFRMLLVVNFDQLLSLSVGFRRNAPLPPPSTIASLLQSQGIEFLEKWNDSFGIHYRQVRLGYHYLKNTLKFHFPNRLENESHLQQERREREARSREILLNKFEKLKENFSSFKSEIHSTLHQIDECLDIIHAEDGECHQQSPVEDEESIEFNSSALRQIRLDSLKEATKISENSENKVIFDALRELYKLTVSKHLQSVQEYLSILVRVDSPENRFRDSALKELIDIRNLVRATVKRSEESGLIPSSANSEEEDLWEEGKIEACESKSSSTPTAIPDDSSNGPFRKNDSSNGVISCKNKGKDLIDKETLSNKTSKDNGVDTSFRSKLLAEAPVLKWGTFMDTWGPNRDVLANHRGLEVENHWGRVDPDAAVPVSKIAKLSYHVTTYKEPAAETRPCLAPLKKGGLCQRRDLRVCPFHGPVIARDAEGNPLEKKSEEKEPMKCEVAEESSRQMSTPISDDTPSILGNDLVKELANQAVKNVRQRDSDAKALKKTKLAKVRQHNEAVLREAAMASTSHSAILDVGEASTYQNHPGSSVKKPTLASMLRKKVTAKDRLSQKLLNTRVTESTMRKLKEGDEARYKEAYPNQW